jgi:hypothetical protein
LFKVLPLAVMTRSTNSSVTPARPSDVVVNANDTNAITMWLQPHNDHTVSVDRALWLAPRFTIHDSV